MNDIKSSITETHDLWHRGHIEPFWSKQSITSLDYERTGPSADQNFIKWKRQGYIDDAKHLSGELCDMQKPQPIWNTSLIDWFEKTYNVKDVGTAYFRMPVDTMLPVHSDSYMKYKNLFKCKTSDILRIIIFPIDWSSGHYFELDGTPIVSWHAGDYFLWQGNTPHMAANIGIKYRYSIQLTGHI